MKTIILAIFITSSFAGNSGWNGGHPYVRDYIQTMKEIDTFIKTLFHLEGS